MKCFLVLVLAAVAFAAPAEDLVTNLPGLGYTINFNQYSGYLNGSAGNHLHYWFVESQDDPGSDPVVLWLNGGPGCSSLDGLLSENGPFFATPDGSALYENVYSWNKVANMLYIESPPCVGFSYDDSDNCAYDDDSTAATNYLALKQFFTKFPEYLANEFFITGESYAGLYVPTLSVLVVDGNGDFPLNFQGYAIGNGLLNYEYNQNSLLFYGYYHSLLGQDLWDNLVTECCNGIEGQFDCNFYSFLTLPCEQWIVVALDIMYNEGLNIYNLYENCDVEGPPATTSKSRAAYDLANIFRNAPKSLPEPIMDIPCINSYPQTTWLNQADVRTALHIPAAVPTWEVCSDDVSSQYVGVYSDVASQMTYLQGKVRALIYNGDTDMACNVLGNEWLVTTLAFVETEGRAVWEYSDDIAGYVVRYEGLDFLTVRGSGHMVPADRPGQALQMITAFLNDDSYDL